MKREINPLVVAVIVVFVVAAVIGGLMYFSGPRPPAGVKYTPGVPPWKEKGAGPYSPIAPAGSGQAAQPAPGGPPMAPPVTGGR